MTDIHYEKYMGECKLRKRRNKLIRSYEFKSVNIGRLYFNFEQFAVYSDFKCSNLGRMLTLSVKKRIFIQK